MRWRPAPLKKNTGPYLSPPLPSHPLLPRSHDDLGLFGLRQVVDLFGVHVDVPADQGVRGMVTVGGPNSELMLLYKIFGGPSPENGWSSKQPSGDGNGGGTEQKNLQQKMNFTLISKSLTLKWMKHENSPKKII